MNPLLPILDELDDARTDAARAAWLLACPLSVLITYQSTIRNRLQNGFFVLGVAWLDAELAAMRSVRQAGVTVGDNPVRVPLMAVAGLDDAAGGASPTDL